MRTVLANPRCTGRQVWNPRRTDHDLVDPANTTLGHLDVMRWNTPSDWIISARPAHPALVSEADFITVQNLRPRHQTAQGRTYLLAGLLCCGDCGDCGRRMESHWSHDSPGYRCRHGHTSATRPGPGLAGQLDHPGRAAVSRDAMRPPTPARQSFYLRSQEISLAYDAPGRNELARGCSDGRGLAYRPMSQRAGR